MRKRRRLTAVLLGLAVLLPLGGVLCAEPQVDSGVIRLGGESSQAGSDPTVVPGLEGRRGFDYNSFEQRLESLWFQRKAFLAAGRERDAAKQSRQLEAFCAEEDVSGLSNLASALIAESKRYLDEGSYEKALSCIRRLPSRGS